MLTLPKDEGLLLTGGVQTALLTEDQLEVGVFLTGEFMRNVWRVDAVNRAEGIIVIRQQPEMPVEAEHQHAFTQQQNTTCLCGTRRQHVRHNATVPNSGLLPVREGRPRVYIIRPREPLLVPDQFTVYLTAVGEIVTVCGTQWSRDLPLVPTLHPVWILPEALRGRVR